MVADLFGFLSPWEVKGHYQSVSTLMDGHCMPEQQAYAYIKPFPGAAIDKNQPALGVVSLQ
jgi:hypothetical protein